MTRANRRRVEEAKDAALHVLLHNARGPFRGLPRTAGWGYPEPYTRDMMIVAFGILVSGNRRLIAGLRGVLEALAANQTEHGHIPSLANDREDRGASDTTPLFLIGVALFRTAMAEPGFLEEAVQKALRWMDYQSPSDRVVVAQQPTSDWRDEQWVTGFGLYVNTLVYTHLKLYGRHEKAARLRKLMNRFTVRADRKHAHEHEGLVLHRKPYYAFWSYKMDSSERFDLLGNSLAVLSGIASRTRARSIVRWIEAECTVLRERGLLAVDLPPCFFPYITPDDPDWRPRYEKYNRPGEYHNGGVWPFIGGFYVAAMVAAGFPKRARRKLWALTELVRPAHTARVSHGFNEWIKAQDGTPSGNDWQSWSAAMYLYAARCVESGSTPFFDGIRQGEPAPPIAAP
ncbi:MAG: amylo-alpha-1,6-glucosidase [Kiritimatiellae bacterium]|nr:amylo-alpha-1,6-glucosidase [Kiritimatiellia bacterium]